MVHLFNRHLLMSLLGIQCISLLFWTTLAQAENLAKHSSRNSTPFAIAQADKTEQLVAQIASKVPIQIVDKVRRDLAYKTNIHPANLRLQSAEPQVWSDGCLGLGEKEEICAMSLVEGWRVVLTYREQSWTYRTDYAGQVLRMEKLVASTEPSNSANYIPAKVLAAVFTDLSNRGISIPPQFSTKAEPRQWQNGCLEIADAETVCTQAITLGWQLTLTSGKKRWVYHTDATGSVLKFNVTSSQ